MTPEQAAMEGFQGTVAGKIKDTGTYHWVEESSEATSESGFTALPDSVESTGYGMILYSADVGENWERQGVPTFPVQLMHR